MKLPSFRKPQNSTFPPLDPHKNTSFYRSHIQEKEAEVTAINTRVSHDLKTPTKKHTPIIHYTTQTQYIEV